MQAENDFAALRGQTVLVTGAGGMLGRAFVQALSELGGVTVHALPREDLDVTDERAVMACARYRPQVILHCAALTNADKCEREPEHTRRVQVGGTHYVGQLACEVRARVFYPQSVLIFDGDELPFTEQTLPRPGSVYSETKLEAERHLFAEVPGTLSVRMAGFFGGDKKDKNFVGTFVRELEARIQQGEREVEVGDRVWQPTYTYDLARNSLLLLALGRTGIYHMGALGEASFYDVAQVCVDALGLAGRIAVIPCSSEVFDAVEAVQRPGRMVTANRRLEAEGLCRQRPWEEALREYLTRPYFDRFRRLASPQRTTPVAIQSNGAPASRGLCEPWTHPTLGELQSRVVMSAMTRSFAGPGNVPTPEMAAYYARRAEHGVGLILTESTAVHPSAEGFPDAPQMYTEAQVKGWRAVTTAVHAAGAKIFSQLAHCGRISHEDYTGGVQPVSSTDRRADGINRRNGQPYALPHRLGVAEIPSVYELFRRASAKALEAGFDGVELHLGHGYLADQFLDARVNNRTDAYGGSIENRCRFALELTEALLAECGATRVMVRISPSRWMGGLYDWPDLDEMLRHLIPAFDAVGLRLLDVSCARADYYETSGRVIRAVRPLWPHFLMGGASLSREQAQAELDDDLLDMVTYGRFLLANPDLVERFRDGRELEPFGAHLLDTLH